jgi:hypothetical protein
MAAAAGYLSSDLDDDQSEASEISEDIEADAAGQSSGDGAVSGSEDGRSGGEANAADHSLDVDVEAGVTEPTNARDGGRIGACCPDSTCSKNTIWHAASARACPRLLLTSSLDVQMAAEGRHQSHSARSGLQERAQQSQRRLPRRRAAPQTTLAQQFCR